jgi:hypothetical protein
MRHRSLRDLVRRKDATSVQGKQCNGHQSGYDSAHIDLHQLPIFRITAIAVLCIIFEVFDIIMAGAISYRPSRNLVHSPA